MALLVVAVANAAAATATAASAACGAAVAAADAATTADTWLFSSERARGKQKLQLWRRCRFFLCSRGSGTSSHWPPPDFCPSLSLLARSASPSPLPPTPASFTPLDAHRALFLSFYSFPSSTCYHSRNGPTVVSWTRGGGRRVTQRGEGGREKEGCRATDGGGRREREQDGRHTGILSLSYFSPRFAAHRLRPARSHAHTAY